MHDPHQSNMPSKEPPDMPTKPVVFSRTDVELRTSPINPDWIIEGKPVARNALLSTSDDQTATTLIWDCTKGKFNWYYDFDETVHFLEGSVTIDDGHSPPRTLGPGDVIFFPKGSHAVWTVHDYIRKLAFCRRTLPGPLGSMVKVAIAAKRRLSPPAPGSLMSAN
jgi:uncharacterized cupin superfamily protein